MAQHVLDVTVFRATFPAFADAGTFPDGRIQTQWDFGTIYIGDYDGALFGGPGMQGALELMTAHLLALQQVAVMGMTAAILTAATIDKVQVQIKAPPIKTAWQQWLALTPYGMQLWALLTLKSAGGFYLGGAPVRAGSRGPLGGFGRGWC